MQLIVVTHSKNVVQAMDAKQYAMGALTQGHKLDLIEFKPKALLPNEVFVDIRYCGMCHS